MGNPAIVHEAEAQPDAPARRAPAATTTKEISPAEHIDSAQDIEGQISLIAYMYGVSSSTMSTIINRESMFDPKKTGDMHIICPRTGRPVRARGLAQITECYHPEISDAEAYDAHFSLIFLAESLAAGKCWQWTTCPK